MEIAGKPVENAKKSITIHISADDCKKGENKDPAKCAAALALLRETGAEQVRVHLGRTYLKTGKTWLRYATPKALRTEIIAFDRGGAFSPGEFTLSPMQPSKRTGKRQGGPDKPRRKRRKIAKKYHIVEGVRAHGANK